MRSFFVFVISFFLFIASYSSAEADSGKFVLENGLTVVAHEMPSNPMVSVYGLIKAGGATEGQYLGSGLSHFLEHMLFKGTEHRGIGEIAKTIQAVGGSINAQTSYDYTMFTITVPKDSFDTAVELLADALFHSSLDAAEIEKERQVIFGEMRMRKDNPDVYLNDLMYRSVYLNHPYRHPVIGYPDLLAKVSRDALNDFYKTYYTPNNMVIAVAGGVDKSQVFQKVHSVFEKYERSSPIPRNLMPDPAPISPQAVEEFYPTDVARLAIAFQSTRLMDQDLFALDVLAKLLGQGLSSRLYTDLYQKKNLVYGVSSYNYTPYDRGLFVIEAVMDDAKRSDVEKEILRHIELLQKQPVTAAELEKARAQVESEYLMSQQTTEHQAYSLALDEFLAGDYAFSQKYVEGVRSVTADDIKRVAQRYLQKSLRTTIILRPQATGVNTNQKMVSSAEPVIVKKILKNGLTVLLREDHTFPLVSVTLACNGGLLQESESLNGISTLTASVWIKQTKNKSVQQLAEFVDANGMELGQFSGRNSLGIKLELLSKDWTKGLGLLDDLVKNPAFSEEEIKKSKQLMKVAIRQRQDDIFDYSSSALKKILFPGHPYALDQEGTVESLDRITRKDIIDFYQRLVVPRNMVLSVYGDISSEKILKDLEARTGLLKDQPADLLKHNLIPLVKSQAQVIHLDKQQALLLMGFRGSSIASSDVYGLEVLTAVLGSSFSGRLFNRVREELGKAYSVGGQFVPGLESGGIIFYVLTTESDIQKVQDVVEQEIAKLRNELISVQELADVKSYLKGSHKSDQQTSAAMGFLTALDELYGLGFARYQVYDASIDRVTPNDMQRLAKQYLDDNQRVVVMTVPTIQPKGQ